LTAPSDPSAFSSWFPLTPDGVREHAPPTPAAVQVRRAEGLVVYPEGKSAMVFYFFAGASVREALSTAFADELATPGARGHGPLWFRYLAGERSQQSLASLFDEFEDRFGAPPALHGTT
jgi:hypothetical protein